MKPEELMIGDILEYMGTIVKVYSIGAKICIKECFGKNTYIVDFDNLLKGLELTSEILEKNGFVKQAYDGWLISEDNGRGLIEYRTDYFDGMLRINYTKKPFSKISLKLKHVHELQHALRLCGIDKEIEI